jgi:hypothetical protein
MNDGAPLTPGIAERLARLESGQEWTKILLGLIAAVMIGGFSFLAVQISRLDTKIDALGGRISAENATTRQELTGIATAIANSITATRQVQPQILPVPWPPLQPTPGSPPGKQ